MGILTDFARFINSDRYQYTEADVYLHQGMQQNSAVFECFFRKTEDGGFAVVSGILSVVELVQMLNETSEQEKRSYFSKVIEEPELLDFLCRMRFKGNIFAMREGEICYPYEPVIIVEDELIAAKTLETPLLNALNFQMAIASKASRVTRAAGAVPVAAFGARRAHGFDGAVLGTRAALIGGCTSHSSLAAELLFGQPASGTMSHSFIQSFGVGSASEKAAFNAFIRRRKNTKNNTLILLLDTYSTLKIGIENAIAAFKENGIDDSYPGVYGIRIDSGDLAYLSKQCRKKLQNAGFKRASIVLSNSLDEFLLADLMRQGASFDLLGIGDSIGVSRDNPNFGGVYKMAAMNGRPVIKISDDPAKNITPHAKEIFRIYQKGEARADLICLRGQDSDKEKLLDGQQITIVAEHNPLAATTFESGSYDCRPLLVPMIINGNLTPEALQLRDIERSQAFYLANLASLSDEHKRLVNPHSYKVDLSSQLLQLKTTVIQTALQSP